MDDRPALEAKETTGFSLGCGEDMPRHAFQSIPANNRAGRTAPWMVGVAGVSVVRPELRFSPSDSLCWWDEC